ARSAAQPLRGAGVRHRAAPRPLERVDARGGRPLSGIAARPGALPRGDLGGEARHRFLHRHWDGSAHLLPRLLAPRSPAAEYLGPFGDERNRYHRLLRLARPRRALRCAGALQREAAPAARLLDAALPEARARGLAARVWSKARLPLPAQSFQAAPG